MEDVISSVQSSNSRQKLLQASAKLAGCVRGQTVSLLLGSEAPPVLSAEWVDG